MRAMLFAAGKGTRLRPITDRLPKALVPVAGKPLLAIIIERLRNAGVEEIVINIHHFGEQILDYLSNNDFGVNISVSDERESLLDTGGGLKKAVPLFSSSNEPILLHNVDILSNADIALFYEKSSTQAATLLVSSRKTSRYLLFDENNCLRAWQNVMTGEVRTPYADIDLGHLRPYAFSGIHCFSPSLFPFMEIFADRFSLIDFYLQVCDKVDVKCEVKPDLRMLDVGKIDTLERAEEFLQNL
ncbi:nucleotidyltransferase family protein [Alloprevotella tannerae]|uniref:Nucleotidyltransferase family protein n=1 Tax=Alloprevotella tannerae TaxID=76122 RepID=A0A929RVV2_9BACT|nr:nucleotidyltransferase family protein [Alloprevotella tannerae]MBF0970205.1 nucleotidyltransferase family protein [Alloprevotella tannerae]